MVSVRTHTEPLYLRCAGYGAPPAGYPGAAYGQSYQQQGYGQGYPPPNYNQGYPQQGYQQYPQNNYSGGYPQQAQAPVYVTTQQSSPAVDTCCAAW